MSNVLSHATASSQPHIAATAPQDDAENRRKLRRNTLAALGVVFGDIGTSPLYALKQCFTEPTGVAISEQNVLGILSLIFWSLILVITVKYVAVMLKADNRGEGGVLALSALLSGITRNWKLWTPIGAMGLLGAALFFGDGLLTPAISVLSAVEGLAVATPQLQGAIVPVTLLVLLALFAAQKKGTGAVGKIFGPIMIVWFAVLGVLGAMHIADSPNVLRALNPWHAMEFFAHNRLQGFIALSAVFLAVTGGEALYADMGHFGRLPIRNAWLRLVMPALVLNYFGQGALLLGNPEAISNPFYLLAPTWALPPLIALATAATIIASQAVISGVFSVTSQALNLGFLPRLKILHSSETEIGQIYVPSINWLLFLGTASLVLAFRSSDALAGAYGIAIASTMLIAGLMIDMLKFFTRRETGRMILAVSLILTLIDLAFFGANMLRFFEGGWFSVTAALLLYVLMQTWHQGRRLLNWTISTEQLTVREFLGMLRNMPPQRVPGTAVYMTGEASAIPRSLVQSVRFYGALHERNILLTFVSTEKPRLGDDERLSAETVAPGIVRLIARHGFMEQPNAVATLKAAATLGIEYRGNETIFVVGRDAPMVTRQRGMAVWRKKLFSLMSRNSQMAPAHYGVPVHRLIEIGSQTAL